MTHFGHNCPLFQNLRPISRRAASRSRSSNRYAGAQRPTGQLTHISAAALILLHPIKPVSVTSWTLWPPANGHMMPVTSLWIVAENWLLHKWSFLCGWDPHLGLYRIFQTGLRMALVRRLLGLCEQCDKRFNGWDLCYSIFSLLSTTSMLLFGYFPCIKPKKKSKKKNMNV